MRMKPIDKRLLIHTVKGTPKRLASKPEPEVITKVRLSGKRFYTPMSPQQQTVQGNWIMYGCDDGSGKDKDGKMPNGSVGDTIEFVKDEAPIYPKLTTVMNVTPFYDVDNKHIHHWEITLL